MWNLRPQRTVKQRASASAVLIGPDELHGLRFEANIVTFWWQPRRGNLQVIAAGMNSSFDAMFVYVVRYCGNIV